ncbi:hypothetical protein HZB60_01810 [candidate division KSB1 bacterium]|nr:hypothetical protein [candidate division KSB1 bacterium]
MTLREKLLRRACWFWWKLREGRIEAAFKVTSAGVRPQHLMVVLPAEFHDFDVARNVIEPLLQRTQPRFATICLRENFRTWLSPDLRAKIVTFNPARKNWLGLPTNGICEQARDVGADVVIDLTPSFSPYTAAITAASRAPLRITVERELGSEFYNCYVLPDGDRDLAGRYEMLLRYV